jgi:hypothetical protein
MEMHEVIKRRAQINEQKESLMLKFQALQEEKKQRASATENISRLQNQILMMIAQLENF